MKGSKIMVVDDEAGIRDILSEILAVKGFEVTSAKDGMESLRYMRTKNYDLVVTDINMPHLNGIELLKKMKKAGRKEKIVIMTGSAFELPDHNNDMPMIYFQLKKPFKIDDFLHVVSSVLKSKRSGARVNPIKKAGRKNEKCYIN